MRGKIIKGIAGFYYVYGEDGYLYECKGRGILRQKKLTPLVGDDVVISVEEGEPGKGSLEEILPRKNSLIRPAVSNVDQALIVFSRTKPAPSLGLLDRLLIAMERLEIRSIIVFNKSDLKSTLDEYLEEEKAGYRAAGYEVHDICVTERVGLDEVRALLQGKTTTLAGPSGVGKSSLINRLCPEADMETGEISEKLSRGRHTTRHAQLHVLDKDSFVFDTPGFSSFEVRDMEAHELGSFYPEFRGHEESCKFALCSHTHEPDCGVRLAVEAGRISGLRYERYKKLYEELKGAKKY